MTGDENYAKFGIWLPREITDKMSAIAHVRKQTRNQLIAEVLQRFVDTNADILAQLNDYVYLKDRVKMP